MAVDTPFVIRRQSKIRPVILTFLAFETKSLTVVDRIESDSHATFACTLLFGVFCLANRIESKNICIAVSPKQYMPLWTSGLAYRSAGDSP